MRELPVGGGGGKFLGEMIVAAEFDERSTLMGETVAAEFRGETWADDRPLAGDGPFVCWDEAVGGAGRSGVVCVEFCGDVVDNEERAMSRARTASRWSRR